ncbi:MAG: hypothetical protein KBC43_03165 [Bacteroidales bacterium]|nr:hypothetical protein [Bacteroidales bacterium]
MGLFDFLKPNKKEINNELTQMNASFYPKGAKDINAVTDEVLYILDNKISRDEARTIALRSVTISRISSEFSEERLKRHLAGYCLHHFNDNQVKKFHGYLSFLTIASVMFKASPSEVVRDGDMWLLPS